MTCGVLMGLLPVIRLSGFQRSARGGLVYVECMGTERVILRGEAVTVLQSIVLVDE
jgi:hypothetical protein